MDKELERPDWTPLERYAELRIALEIRRTIKSGAGSNEPIEILENKDSCH